MKIATIAGALLLMTAPGAFAAWDDCRYTEGRNAVTSSAGITRVVVHAGAGSLQVDGVPSAGQIVASGTACTSDEDFLPKIGLTLRRVGSEIHVDSRMPEKFVIFGFFEARLDLSVKLPAGLPVSIEDDSGWMKVANTGSTTIEDDSGSIEVKNVRGDLSIDDDSGGIEIDGVTGAVRVSDDSGELIVKNAGGNVEIEDDSGSITVEHVGGSLHIPNDDSGSITVRDVRHDVTIDDDSSGSIDVTDVGGGFRVGRKSSGSIDYQRVAGRVEIPSRRHR